MLVIQSLSVGGTEKLFVSLVNHFAPRMIDVGMVVIGSHNPLASEIRSGGPPPVLAHRRFRGDFWQPAAIIRDVIVSRQAQIVLSFGLWENAFTRLALRGLRVPRVVALHFTRPRNLRNYLLYFAYSRLLTDRDRLICVCNAQADYLSRVYLLDRARISIIYNGVETEFFDPAHVRVPERLMLRRSLGLSASQPVILQVANLSPAKRHEDALEAMAQLSREHSDLNAVLVLVGEGTDTRRTELEALARRLRIRHRVVFAGFQRDLRPYYAISDCFTLSSVAVEAFSIAALEALSMGVPIALTDIGGAREMVREGVNGLVVPARHPANLAAAWFDLISQPRDALRIRRDAVSRFDIGKCAQSYQELMSELAGDCNSMM